MNDNDPPHIFGEVFDDGQFRGSYKIKDIPPDAMIVGDYLIWNFKDNCIGIQFEPTGETGIFKKVDFEPYLKAFFGLNF
jgi:hypothetical protein